MKTGVETQLFEKQWPAIWTEAEHDEFIDWLAANPETGDVIPHTNGVRKVRWKRAGSGKVVACVLSMPDWMNTAI